MGLARFDFQLSVALREELAVKALVFGPPALVGAASSSEQDYHFFCLFTALLATTHYRFGSLRRMIQLGALAILPLPTMIYLFDGIEFNTFFASAVDRAGMPWFSNAVLLYLSLSVFIAATAFPVASRVASRLARRVQHSFRQERDFQVED